MDARIQNCGYHVAYACGYLKLHFKIYSKIQYILCPQLLVVLLHLVMHSSGLPASLSFYPLWVKYYSPLGAAAMQFLNALAEAALASSATGTDVNKAAFISWVLQELGVTMCVGNELVYGEVLHVYVAAGGTRACMGMHVPTTDVTYFSGYFYSAYLHADPIHDKTSSTSMQLDIAMTDASIHFITATIR
jgi:hypothetical protein